MQSTEEISAPVMPEGSQEQTSCLAQIGWALGIGIAGFVVIILFIQLRIARGAAASLQSSRSLRTMIQAVTLYEQTHNVAIATLPDWKKALVESGYVDEEIFESTKARNGEMQYLLLSYPNDQHVTGLPSCIAIVEDPRSLRDPSRNVFCIFDGDGYADACTRTKLPEYMQMRCRYLDLPYDPAVLAPAFPPDTSPETTYPK